MLEQPCYLIGIAITLFDVHMNRSPIDGKIILVKHTPGTSIGLNTHNQLLPTNAIQLFLNEKMVLKPVLFRLRQEV